MEVDTRLTEQYSDIGGLEKQIQEVIEAVVLPMTHKERFINLGIKPPKGVLMCGPPGTGKTLMARASASQTNSCFFKLAGPQLVQMFIGDGAELVRDELDAIGTKRITSEKAGDRMELRNRHQQNPIPGPRSVEVRSSEQQIEFPAPTEEARARIMQIHARKMNVCPDVNYEELAR